jgi:catechol 2,3-dioxygenase-like lactoylglutathione lyase family enzyme
MSAGVQRLIRVGRNTRELDRAVAFYCDALGFKVTCAEAPPPAWTQLTGLHDAPSLSRCAELSLGAEALELTEFPNAAPYPDDRSACDLAFQHCAIVVNDMAAAHQRVMAHGAQAITQGGPQTLPPEAGAVTAFKFRDPDGHPLELIQFPPGTGDREWQTADCGGVALGIDHSAISVADAERSIAFYTALGLRVATRGVNRGVEQQQLDDLADVAVDVVRLDAVNHPPHLELLGYRHPRALAAASTGATAVAADRLVWRTADIDVLLSKLGLAGYSENMIVTGCQDDTKTALLHDPDGHWIVLVQ